ncbi:hypothetical protein [Tardisphaera saccharovorans]
MSYTPVIITYLKERVKNWQRYEDFVSMELKDSPLDVLLFNSVPVELTLGEVNWVLIGVKKGYEGEASAELTWKGYIKRTPQFVGPSAKELNSDPMLIELIKLIDPVGAEVAVKKAEDRADLNVSISVFYLPSPGFKTKLLGAVRAIEVMYGDVAKKRP